MVSQKNQILTFLSNNPDQEYDNDEIWKQVFDESINFSTVRGRLSELHRDKKITGIREIRKGKLITWYGSLLIYRKIVKLGASCNGKFKRLYSITFESNDNDRQIQLTDKLFSDFPECTIFEFKDEMDIKGEIIVFGYSIEEWYDKVPFVWDLIETGEEGISTNRN